MPIGILLDQNAPTGLRRFLADYDFVPARRMGWDEITNGGLIQAAEKAHNIGRPNAAKYLDEALRYILGHDGVWNTTADDIAEYHIANYYDKVASWIIAQQSGLGDG